jgi:thiamine-monophosphate kinase
MRAACEEYALTLVGGDLSRGSETSIAVTIAGEVAPGRAVLRSGARAGDRLAVTGTLGGSAGGLLLARAGGPAPLTGWGRELVEAHQRPVARVGEAAVLAAAGASAMMDISDGLAIDLSRVCAASGVGARASLGAVPVAPGLAELARTMDVDPLELALFGGEDYELLVGLPAVVFDDVSATLRERFGCALTDLGAFTADVALVGIEADGTEVPLPAKGWDHFG